MPKDLKMTHFDQRGNPRMVDVGDKEATHRQAVAEGFVYMSQACLDAIQGASAKKGDVLMTAQLAGIQGAKRTSDLIPLCHPLPLDGVDVEISPGVFHGDRPACRIQSRVSSHWRTGVEMEALTAVMAAALTVYDMLKGMDRSIQIDGVRLLSKTGGRTKDWNATLCP